MTNDLTTVEGSFQQLIDDLENNLQEKGINAQYDATTGIRGLVAKISEIEPLPSYDIRFETHDLVKYFQDPDKQFFANVYDDGEKVTRTDIKYYNDDIGTTLNFILNDSNNNSVTYPRKYSDANNAVKLNIQMPSGEYDIITNYKKDNSIFATTNHITILPNFSLQADEIAILGTNHPILIHKEGEPIINETFEVNCCGQLSELTTDNNGYIYVPISCSTSPNAITVEKGREKYAIPITIRNVEIRAENFTKKYGTAGALLATLVDEDGNPISGESLTFEITGVTYQRTTNADGVAKLNINKQVGEYSCTISWYAISTTVTITITN